MLMGRCSGRHRRLFAIALSAELLCGPAASSAAGSGTPLVRSVEQLAAMLGSIQGCEIQFDEQKQTPLLSMPLKSSGTLYYDRALGLARQVRTPRPSLVVIDDRVVRFEGADGWQALDVGAYPGLADVIGGLLDVLKGDTERLARTYSVQFEPEDGAEKGWRLMLEPRDPASRELVQRIVLEGHGHDLRRLVVAEHGGMESTSTLRSVDMARRFSDEERRTLFRLSQ